MIVVVTTFDFLTEGDKWGRWAVLPGWSTYIAELLGALATVIVVLVGVRTRFRYVRAEYWIVFGILTASIVGGIAINGVDAGPVFAGIRNYLRAVPWFLLPAVVAFADRELAVQLRLLAAIALMQLPLSIQQTSTALGAGKPTGDWTIGTLMLSPTLTIFMVSCICVASAFFVRKLLRPWQFLVLLVLFLVPTTINETKATIFLLPIGLIVSILVAARPEQRVRYAATGCLLIALAAAVFVPVYDNMIKDREYSVSIKEFFSDPERVGRYMSTTDDIGVRATSAGRLDSITVPWKRLSRDPVQLVFGYGMGNASHSALGRGFTGREFGRFGPFMTTTFGRLILELGLFGLVGVLILMWMIFRDACAVARKSESTLGALAAGWAGVTVVLAICIGYIDLVIVTPLAFLFWYFSGVVAAGRMRNLARDSMDSNGRPTLSG